MITLQRLNVVKVVSSEEDAQKLKAQGFCVIQSGSVDKRQKPPGKPPKAPKTPDGNDQDDSPRKDDEDGASGSGGEDSGGGKE